MRFFGERGAGFLLSSSSKGFGFVPEKGEGAVNPCEPDPGAQQQEEEQLHDNTKYPEKKFAYKCYLFSRKSKRTDAFLQSYCLITLRLKWPPFSLDGKVL